MKFRLAVISVLAAGVIVAPRPAIAQEAMLEEIIVTARKREESVQDIPIAVSAFTADDIRELGLLSVDDIALYTPGFSFQSGFGRQLRHRSPRGARPDHHVKRHRHVKAASLRGWRYWAGLVIG